MASAKMLKLTMMLMLGMLLLAAGISATRVLKQDDGSGELEPQPEGAVGADAVEAYNAIEGAPVVGDDGEDLPELAHKRKLSTFWRWRSWRPRFQYPWWGGGWPWNGWAGLPVPYATASVATVDGNSTASAEAGFRQPDPQFPGVGPADGLGNRLFG